MIILRQAGANDYVRKPFSRSEVKIQGSSVNSPFYKMIEIYLMSMFAIAQKDRTKMSMRLRQHSNQICLGRRLLGFAKSALQSFAG